MLNGTGVIFWGLSITVAPEAFSQTADIAFQVAPEIQVTRIAFDIQYDPQKEASTTIPLYHDKFPKKLFLIIEKAE